jgi:serine/threonine protein kinase
LAVKYLNSERVSHLDIKPDNIMVSLKHDGSIVLKLIDFNVSKIFGETKNGKIDSERQMMFTGGQGLKEWSAPETRLKSYYGIEADYWSIGCIIYYSIMGQ